MNEPSHAPVWIFIIVFTVIVIGLAVTYDPIPKAVSDSVVNDSVFDPHAAHSVQIIDNCEYILYQTKPEWGERRLIHKGNCSNHD